MKILRWILVVPIAVAAAIFAVNNREPVTVDLWPFPYELDIRLVLLLFVVLAVGFFLGLATGWIAALARRRPRRAVRPSEPRHEDRDQPGAPATGGVPAVSEPREGQPPATRVE